MIRRRMGRTNDLFAHPGRYRAVAKSSWAARGRGGTQEIEGGRRGDGAFTDTGAVPRLTGRARAARVSRWARMAAITRGSVITASMRSGAPKRGSG